MCLEAALRKSRQQGRQVLVIQDREEKGVGNVKAPCESAVRLALGSGKAALFGTGNASLEAELAHVLTHVLPLDRQRLGEFWLRPFLCWASRGGWMPEPN